LAFLALRSIQGGGFADVVLDRLLHRADLGDLDRRLLTELVYGTVRRQRTLDALIDQLGKKKAHQQPPDLRLILHLGLYQLRYLDQIPLSAAVNSSVELAKHNGFPKLAGVVNGLLRQYLRLREQGADPLQLPPDPVARLGTRHSYPDWIIQLWAQQLGDPETEQLCEYLNQPPAIDIRVNPLRASLDQVEAAMTAAGIAVRRFPPLPQALRFLDHPGPIHKLPGYQEGWWTVQDSSAQLVGHWLAPQPGEVILDACAAPGGKTMHLAELIQDQGTIWACDRTPSRLRRLQQNIQRLGLKSIQCCPGDSRTLTRFAGEADRVLVDAPCSGLGTLHRHADARWRQTPETAQELARLQAELLDQTATWVRPGGILVYATCTLNPGENEAIVEQFLGRHSNWSLVPPSPESPAAAFAQPQGWLKVWPHRAQMDGFFIAKIKYGLV